MFLLIISGAFEILHSMFICLVDPTKIAIVLTCSRAKSCLLMYLRILLSWLFYDESMEMGIQCDAYFRAAILILTILFANRSNSFLALEKQSVVKTSVHALILLVVA